ncbi:hypothetical protein K4K56_005526 [Colletotrichum sp. SAR 10_98]|nr:hypothetical protein K4K56_005526 [Colletotrichum sp. SAR 10_98]
MEADDDASTAQNDTSTASDDASKIIDVAADGDIIMIVGPEQRKFRVHSVMLKSASKVFNAMLGPNFAEGRQLRNNGHYSEITKIELPEDNADGISAIFHLLHHRVDKLPDPMPADLSYQLGIAADKYDLVSTLKYTITGAIHQTINNGGELENMNMRDVWLLAITAACFDDASDFKTLTHILIWYHDHGFVFLAEKAAIDSSLAYRLCGLLEFERSSIRSEICRAVLAECSFERRDSPDEKVTQIQWPPTSDSKWDMAQILTKKSLQKMWERVNDLDADFEFWDYTDCMPWMKGIRETGSVLLKDARGPKTDSVVGRQNP